MKKIIIKGLFLFILFGYITQSYAQEQSIGHSPFYEQPSKSQKIVEQPPLKWLQQMQQAQHQQDYEIAFINVHFNDIKSLRYRHISFDGNDYAQMITLEGSQQEILRRNDLVGYFQPNFQSFSLKASHIIDYLPSILRGNLKDISQQYDFINIGLNRIADRLVHTIKIIPKDNFRYQYMVFIDTESHLLLRSDILDRDGNLLEQYLVVNLVLNNNVASLAKYFSQVKFPPLLPEEKKNSEIFNWHPTWIPKGFKLINQSVEYSEGNKIESQIYSDGMFSFSINISQKFIPNEPEKGWKQGTLTLYTINKNNRELTFTGQLPILSAKRILEDIQFK